MVVTVTLGLLMEASSVKLPELAELIVNPPEKTGLPAASGTERFEPVFWTVTRPRYARAGSVVAVGFQKVTGAFNVPPALRTALPFRTGPPGPFITLLMVNVGP